MTDSAQKAKQDGEDRDKKIEDREKNIEVIKISNLKIIGGIGGLRIATACNISVAQPMGPMIVMVEGWDEEKRKAQKKE